MKNINIPEPCSEDWNKMTPNEKGAFCQKCALDVYDFTNKSGDEIRDILTLNIGSHVCMRIETKQLDELNNDFAAWKMNNKQSYQRAWVFTLLVVFGMTLFSCEEDEVPVVEKYQKTAQIILEQEDEKKIIDPVIPAEINSQALSLLREQYEQVVENLVEIERESTVIVGEARMMRVTQNDDGLIRPSEMRETYPLGGVPKISPEYDLYLLDTYEGMVDSVDVCEQAKISGLVYPNPASNQTTLKVDMPKRGKGEIELFALSGQKIRTVHSGRLRKGGSEFPIDLTDLETGMYLVVIYSGETKVTVKFSKI